MAKTHLYAFPLFDTIPECDGRTDRQMDRQTDMPPQRLRSSFAARCKKFMIITCANAASVLCSYMHRINARFVRLSLIPLENQFSLQCQGGRMHRSGDFYFSAE